MFNTKGDAIIIVMVWVIWVRMIVQKMCVLWYYYILFKWRLKSDNVFIKMLFVEIQVE